MPTFNNFQQQGTDKPKFTGKQLVMLAPNSTHKAISTQAKKVSLNFASFSDFKTEDYKKAFDDSDGIVFEKLGIVIVNEDKGKQVSLLTESSVSKKTFIYSEPERYVYALAEPFEEFMRGYKTAVDHIYTHTVSRDKHPTAMATIFHDDNIASWGIHATNVLSSKFTGKGVNVAILDTGFNLKHPDFAGRKVVSESFIQGEKVDDQNGHGSHCTGISTGDINKSTNRRYGAAKDAGVFIGKVLSNAGSGDDSGILAGIEWAITNGCKVISMSLGSLVEPGEPFSNIYDDMAKKVMLNGTLIIAAAGNDSRRDHGLIMPVSHPANCPSIMAVAALDNTLDIANFSCGGINTNGGEVDIAGPGVDVYSAWKFRENYQTISGTSMATPFVAGIAALYWEAYPKATAAEIWMYLTHNAKRLSLNSSDVGSGLVQAP